MNYEKISQELIDMRNAEQSVRAAGKVDVELDKRNAARLSEVIGEIGWPDYDNVGLDASDSAWLIAQHADFDPLFQERCLSLMKEKVIANKVNKLLYAYLRDRVDVNLGRPQTYGTQWGLNKETGKMEPRLVTDVKTVNELRAELGMEGLEEYGAKLQKRQDELNIG